MKGDFKARSWSAVAALLSAVLLWSAFAGRGEALNVFFALAPLMLLSRLLGPGRSARWWFAGGFAFWFATLSWMPALVKNGGPWPLVALGWAALAAYCSLFYAAFGWTVAFVRERIGGGFAARMALVALVEPVAWAGLEWLRGHLFGGFAWNFLGSAAAEFQVAAGPARLGGVYLVSALAVLLNGVVATVVERPLRPMLGLAGDGRGVYARLRRMAETGVPLLLVMAAFLGAARARPAAERWLPLKVALVQRDFPCVFERGGGREDPFEAYARLLSGPALTRPDLVLMSESAMCEFGADAASPRAVAAIRRLAADSGVDGAFLAGGDVRRRGPDGADRLYNAAVLYSCGATNVSAYCKQHLVPFGEFIPLDKVFPALQRLSPLGVSLHPGEPKLLRLAAGGPDGFELAVAPLICYEDTDPDLSLAAARAGAHVFAFITNDSWFSGSAETAAHFRQCVLRSVETGLPALRTGNSGVTGVVYPSGRHEILRAADGAPLVDAAGVMSMVVELAAGPEGPLGALTVYTRLGDWPLLAAALLSAMVVFVLRLRLRRASAQGA